MASAGISARMQASPPGVARAAKLGDEHSRTRGSGLFQARLTLVEQCPFETVGQIAVHVACDVLSAIAFMPKAHQAATAPGQVNPLGTGDAADVSRSWRNFDAPTANIEPVSVAPEMLTGGGRSVSAKASWARCRSPGNRATTAALR